MMYLIIMLAITAIAAILLFLNERKKNIAFQRKAQEKQIETTAIPNSVTQSTIKQILQSYSFVTDIETWDEIMFFKCGEEYFYIRTVNLPILTIERPYKLQDDDDIEVLNEVAVDYTKKTGLGKVVLDENNRILLLQMAILEPTIEYLRHAIPYHLKLLLQMDKDVFAQYNTHKKEESIRESLGASITTHIENNKSILS